MKNLGFCFLLLLSSLTLVSQNEFALPADIDPKYNFLRTYDSLLKEAPKNVTQAEWKNFCIDNTFNIQVKYDKNEFYTNWDEATNYLSKVLKLVCSSDISDKKNNVVIYVLKDDELNASTVSTGKIFVNIGLLANLENEAALAEILGHEYGHYRFEHGVKNLGDYFTTHKKYNKDERLNHFAEFFARKRAHETQSDSIGFMLSGKAGYDIRNGIINIQAFDTEENLQKMSYGFKSLKHEIYIDPQKDFNLKPDSADYYFSSHPSNAQRKKALLELAKGFLTNKKNYLVDSALFHKIQDKARHEVLLTTFNKANYEECLKNAFRFHLLDTANNEYLYYLTEAIRRFMYINPSLKDKGFIMHDSKDPLFKEGKLGVLRKISVFLNDTVQYDKIKTNPLVNTKKIAFDTYKEAYNYFLKISKQKNIAEIYLSEALYNKWLNKRSACDSLLKIYIEKEKCANREFAQKLLSNELFKEPGGAHLFIADNTDYYYAVEGITEYSYYLARKDFKNNVKIKDKIEQRLTNTKTVVLSNYVTESKKDKYDQYVFMLNQIKGLKTDQEHDEMTRPSQSAEYWESMSRSEPENQELLLKQKKLLLMCPELYLILRKEQVNDVNIVYFYNFKAKISFNVFNARFINPYTNEIKVFEKDPEIFKLKESYPEMMGRIIKKFYLTK